MTIHYNNGNSEKLIKGVLAITVYDSSTPVTVALKNGGELHVSLNNIEMILDDEIIADK